MSVYATLVYSPDVADRMQVLGDYLAVGLRVPERLRALAALLTAQHKHADIAVFARMIDACAAGVVEEHLKALTDGDRPENMNADETLVFDYCTELNASGSVPDATFERMVQRFGREIALELVATCGYSALLAMVLNVTEVSIPE